MRANGRTQQPIAITGVKAEHFCRSFRRAQDHKSGILRAIRLSAARTKAMAQLETPFREECSNGGDEPAPRSGFDMENDLNHAGDRGDDFDAEEDGQDGRDNEREPLILTEEEIFYSPKQNGLHLTSNGSKRSHSGPGGFPRKHVDSAKDTTGTASQFSVALTFLKSMVGPFLLYMPKAFSIGGYAYGSGMVALVAAVSSYNMMLLLDCRDVSGVKSFGEIGRVAAGSLGQSAVDFSLFASQFSYCTTYFIFVADNISMVLEAIFEIDRQNFTLSLIVIQLAAYIPLSWIREMKTLSRAMIFANGCIIIGLITVMGFAMEKIAADGFHKHVQSVKLDGIFLFTGSVVICFEGIGLVLPIRDMMAEPKKFKPLLTFCMVGLTIMFCAFGAFGYLAYGNTIERFVIESVADDFRIAGSIAQIAYSIAVLLTYPLQLFPAVTVVHRYLAFLGVKKLSLIASSKLGDKVIRTAIVLCSFGVAATCRKSFDNFVAVVGAFCACPLALIYPIIFHFQLIGTSSVLEKVCHGLLLLGGTIGLVLCAGVSIYTWK